MFKRIKKAEDDPTLKQAQTFVKGWVERLVLSTGVLLVDEEARMKRGMKRNKAASFLANKDGYPDILGPAIFIPFEINSEWY
jgi:hypothetical protein